MVWRRSQRLDDKLVLLSIHFAARLLLCSCVEPPAGASPASDPWHLARGEPGPSADRRLVELEELRRPAGSAAAGAAHDDRRPTLLPAGDNESFDPEYARDRSSPYRLFALSNAASLIGLLAYPFLLEPWLTTLVQARLWSAGYTMFATCCGVAAVVSLRVPEKKSDAVTAASLELAPPPETIDVMTWIALAVLGSLGLVSVTTFIAANVASAPLIWIAPLTLYLVTFILAFEGRRTWNGWSVGATAVLFAAAMLAVYRNEDFVANYFWSLPLFLTGLFFICLFCHGQLAGMKPPPRQLTFFYIMISAGGALGSLSGSVLAPALLNGDFEMPIALAAVGLAFLWQIRHEGRASVIAALVVAVALLGLSAWQIGVEIRGARLLARNFYSSLRVVDTADGNEPLRRLEHGGIEHGSQYLPPARRREPISYYSKTSGVGVAIAYQRARRKAPIDWRHRPRRGRYRGLWRSRREGSLL